MWHGKILVVRFALDNKWAIHPPRYWHYAIAGSLYGPHTFLVCLVVFYIYLS